jgi:hypothetical protein
MNKVAEAVSAQDRPRLRQGLRNHFPGGFGDGARLQVSK